MLEMTSPMGDFEGDLEAEEEALSTRNAPPMTSMEGCEFTINNMSLKNVQICLKYAKLSSIFAPPNICSVYLKMHH